MVKGMEMSFYIVCPLCGARLDPDERCDCANPCDGPIIRMRRGNTVQRIDVVSFVALLKEIKEDER